MYYHGYSTQHVDTKKRLSPKLAGYFTNILKHYAYTTHPKKNAEGGNSSLCEVVKCGVRKRAKQGEKALKSRRKNRHVQSGKSGSCLELFTLFPSRLCFLAKRMLTPTYKYSLEIPLTQNEGMHRGGEGKTHL